MAAVAAVATMAAAQAASGAGGLRATSAGTPSSGRLGRGVLLITGQRLLESEPGGWQVAPGGGGRLAAALVTFGVGGAGFAVPQVALPYLGLGLDPRLFRVSSLVAAESGGRLPVVVSYRKRVPSLPGVVLSHAGGGTAQGYLTAAGARAFGAALTRQFAADHARGSYGQDGLFAGGVSVSLAGTHLVGAGRPAPGPGLLSWPGRAARRPAELPVRTLMVTGTNLAGRPDTGDEVLVANADNAATFFSSAIFHRGVAMLKVPAGHYWAVAYYLIQRNLAALSLRLDVLPQFTVSADTTVHSAARAADSQLTMVTPRPAVMRQLTVVIRHPSPAGPTGWLFAATDYPLFVSPTTERPTVGTLQLFSDAQLTSPAAARGTPYAYDLAFASTSGLIPPQRHVIEPASLATVHARYFSDLTGTGCQRPFGEFPAEFKDNVLPFGALYGFHVPASETEYLSGNPAILWSDGYSQTCPSLSGGQSDVRRIYHAGERARQTWNAYPLHPGYTVNLAGAANLFPWVPSASRAGDTLALDVTPFSDSTPGHTGNGGFEFDGGLGHITGHYEIDENGKTIAAGNPLAGFKEIGPFGEFDAHVTLSPHPSVVRLVLDAAGTGNLFALSGSSHTVWTWHSAHESGARLPAGWTCRATLAGIGRPDRACAVQPMMTLGYTVSGLSLSGSAPAGPQQVHFSAGHLEFAKTAPVTRAAMSVSFDGGKTWRPATVSGSAGSYTAAFTAPAGTKVSLRTSAADAAGGTIAETIINAYKTAS